MTPREKRKKEIREAWDKALKSAPKDKAIKSPAKSK